MKTLRIFIASSAELAEEREIIELEISNLNKSLVKRKLFLEAVLWEQCKLAFSGNRIQDYFNEKMLECDAVIFLFWKKVGEFTLEEFNTAYQAFSKGLNPKNIYVYFKDSDIKISDVKQDLLKISEMKSTICKYQQIYNEFDSEATLRLSLGNQLRMITAEQESKKKKKGAADSSKKIIAFDLDGTLLNGIVFSWDLIWDKLGFSEEHRKFGKIKYFENIFTLQDWCDWAVNAFREENLTRDKMNQFIDEEVNVMENLEKTIMEIRKRGYYVAIISGGIDVFLERKIPNYRELFDDVFINNITFDDQGVIRKCIATPYDFNGKYEALKVLCKKYNVKLNPKSVIFAGDNFNDEEVLMSKNVKFIAVNPNSELLKRHVSNILTGKDLSKILDFI